MLGRDVFVRAPPPLVGRAVLVCAPPPMVGRAALVRGPPLGGACCVSACPPRWWWLAWVVVVCWVGSGCGFVVCFAGVGAVLLCAPPLLGRAVFLRAPPPWWGVLCRRGWVSVRGVVAGSMLRLFCWFAVVFAAVRPTLSGVGCLWCLPGRGRCCSGAWPPAVGACCVCAWPPALWSVPCWCVDPPLVGRALLVCGPPHDGACCVGAWLPFWWGLQCWCLPAAVMVVGSGCPRLSGGLRLRFCCLIGRGWCCAGGCPPPVGACRGCAWPSPWWGVLCRRVWVSVRGVVAGSMLGLFC